MPALPLTVGCTVSFEAINPTTGAAVSGVNISLATIYGVDATEASDGALGIGPYMLVPGPESVSAPATKTKPKGGL